MENGQKKEFGKYTAEATGGWIKVTNTETQQSQLFSGLSYPDALLEFKASETRVALRK
jgi:hypothetical protein